MSEQDSQVIKSIVIVTIAIALIGIVAFFIAQNLGDIYGEQSGSVSSQKAMQERIQPVGKVAVEGTTAKPDAAKAARSGQEIVTASCGACHNSGVAGAPKIGSKGDWEVRAGTGMDAMLASVVKGMGIMPPRGGGDFSDAEIVDAIKAMMASSGL